MNYTQIEDEAVVRLAPLVTAGYSVVAMPNNNSENIPPTNKGIVFVQVAKAEWGGHESTAPATIQPEEIYISLIYKARTLRATGGIYDLQELCRQLLVGWTPSDCRVPCKGIEFGPISPAEYREGVWEFMFVVSTETRSVGFPDADVAPLITQITIDDQLIADAPPTVELYSTAYSVDVSGDQVILAWISTGADEVSIDNGIGVVASSGSMTVTITATTTFEITAVSGVNVATAEVEVILGSSCDPATVKLNSTTIGTAPSGGELDTPVLQDGSPVGSLVGSDWIIPSCPAGVLPATITGGVKVGYGEAMTIGVSESYATYTWVFSSQTYTDQNIETTGQNPTPTLQWDGTWDVKVIVEDGSGGVGYATTTVTVLDGLRYADLEYVPNTGAGGYTGTDKLFTNEDTFFWNGNNNFVIAATADTLSGDGGMIFRAGVDTIRTMGFNTVQDDSGTKNEYLSSTMKWAVHDWGDTSISVKDGGSFPVINTVDLSDMKWFKIDRVSGAFKLYTADNKDDSSWTLIHGYSKTSTDPLYVIAYLHGGTKMCYSQLLKYGDYV